VEVEAKLKTNEWKKDNVTLIVSKKFENVEGNIDAPKGKKNK
jgi:hypothetical protein